MLETRLSAVESSWTSVETSKPVSDRLKLMMLVTRSCPSTSICSVTSKETVSPTAGVGSNVEGSMAMKSAGPVRSACTKNPAGSVPIIVRT